MNRVRYIFVFVLALVLLGCSAPASTRPAERQPGADARLAPVTVPVSGIFLLFPVAPSHAPSTARAVQDADLQKVDNSSEHRRP